MAAVILCQFRVQRWQDYSAIITYGSSAIHSTFSYTWAPREDLGLISSYAILLCKMPLSLPCYDVSARPPFFKFKLPDMLPSSVNKHQLIVNACFVLLPVFMTVPCLELFNNEVLSTNAAHFTISNSFLNTVWLISISFLSDVPFTWIQHCSFEQFSVQLTQLGSSSGVVRDRKWMPGWHDAHLSFPPKALIASSRCVLQDVLQTLIGSGIWSRLQWIC